MRNLVVIDGIPVTDEERAKAEVFYLDQQVDLLYKLYNTFYVDTEQSMCCKKNSSTVVLYTCFHYILAELQLQHGFEIV